MALVIDIMDGRGLSNKARHERQPKKTVVTLYIAVGGVPTVLQGQQVGALWFIEVSGRTRSEAFKTRVGFSFTVRVSPQNNFLLLLKRFITKALEYKARNELKIYLYALLRVP